MPASSDSSKALRKLQAPDPGRLAEQIVGIVSADISSKQKRTALLQLLIGLINAAGAIYFTDNGGELQPESQLISSQAASWPGDLLQTCRMAAQQAIDKQRADVVALANVPTGSILSCPIPSRHRHSQPSCLTVVVLLGENPQEPFLVIQQLMASAFGLIEKPEAIRSDQPDSTPSLLDFFFQSGSMPDIHEFCDHLRSWSGADLVAVGKKRKSGGTQLLGMSDVVKIEARTDKARLFLKVIQERLQSKKSACWPGNEAENSLEESLLIKELVRGCGMIKAVAFYLANPINKPTVLVFLWNRAEKTQPVVDELERTSLLLGPFCAALTPTSTAGREVTGEVKSPWKRLSILAITALGLIGLYFLPLTYRLHPDCLVEPVRIRYIVAGFDALLEKVFVEPGDRVMENEKLASLDGREIELELRSIEADSAKALKMRDNYLVTGEVASAQIAILEYQRLQERANLLSQRQEQLQLQAPISGIVLSGDLKRAEGGPVTRGQVLFKIAPLDTVSLELFIQDEDVGFIQPGTAVEAIFDAFPGKKWQGKIERITPKAEPIKSDNVFTALLEIENSNGTLQPGMQGKASVECGRKPFGWIYFHKPWYALKKMLASLV